VAVRGDAGRCQRGTEVCSSVAADRKGSNDKNLQLRAVREQPRRRSLQSDARIEQ